MICLNDLKNKIQQCSWTVNVDEIFRLIKNGIFIEESQENPMFGQSKYMGNPDFPDNYDQFNINSDFAFVAQLNLNEVKPCDSDNLLPDKGMLYFFVKKINSGDPYPARPNEYQTFYHPESIISEKETDGYLFKFSEYPNLPQQADVILEKNNLSESDFENLDEIFNWVHKNNNPSYSETQILGYPKIMQEYPWSYGLRCVEDEKKFASRDEYIEFINQREKNLLLLFQCPLPYEQMALMYFGIDRDKLKAGDFSEIILEVQNT